MPPTLTIRKATLADVDAVAALEAACFPPAEAAPRASFAARLAVFADRFWLLYADGELVSMVNGLCTDQPLLTDAMFAAPTYHDPSAPIQMIFGVATRPDCRGQGYASMLLERMREDCRAEGRCAVVLTCKPEKRRFYARFGFVDEGVSVSEHGGALWHQMRLTF